MMPQKETLEHLSLFEEVYGSYFQAVRSVLEHASLTPLSLQDMYELVRSCAFEESASGIVPKLTDGPWSSLLEKAGEKTWKSRLNSASLKPPLTTLQKSWLKALLSDRRFRLFFTERQLERLSEDLQEIPALYEQSDFHYFDQYADGDPYETAEYRAVFQTVLKALTENKALFAAYEGGKGNSITLEVLPCRLQYSQKDDKFRLLSVSFRRGRIGSPTILNLGRIKACHLSRTPVPERFDRNRFILSEQKSEPVRIRIENKRNALERCMLHFANYEKQTIYEPDTDTWLCSLFYDPSDETELLIELLSFGPVIRILGPESFLKQVRERVKRQHELFYGDVQDTQDSF